MNRSDVSRSEVECGACGAWVAHEHAVLDYHGEPHCGTCGPDVRRSQLVERVEALRDAMAAADISNTTATLNGVRPIELLQAYPDAETGTFVGRGCTPRLQPYAIDSATIELNSGNSIMANHHRDPDAREIADLESGAATTFSYCSVTR